MTLSVWFQEPSSAGAQSSTNEISHYIGMLDPWYERNVLGLINLPTDVLCQVCPGAQEEMSLALGPYPTAPFHVLAWGREEGLSPSFGVSTISC